MVEQNSIIAIIPVHNRVEELRKSLESLPKVDGLGLRFVVVDDGSTEDIDGLVKGFETEFWKRNHMLEYVRFDRSYGAEKVMNMALEKVYRGEDYILKIDSDTEIMDPSVLTKMIGFLKEHLEIGVLGPRMMAPGVNIKQGAIYWIKLLGILKHVNKREPSEVDFVNGGFIMIRKELYKRLKSIWSNILFRGWNELDLSERARAVGYKTYYYPHAIVLHWFKTTTSKGEKEIYYDLRNLLLLNWKYGSTLSRIVNFYFLLIPRLGYWFLFRSKFKLSPLAAALRDFVLLRKQYSKEFQHGLSGVATL